MKIYIASTLTNWQAVRDFRDRVQAVGIEVTYDWSRHGEDLVSKPVDKSKLPAIALGEATGVLDADAVVFLKPGRRGAYFEIGIAWALKIPIIIVDGEDDGDRPLSFDYLESGITHVPDVASAMEALLHVRATRQCCDSPA